MSKTTKPTKTAKPKQAGLSSRFKDQSEANELAGIALRPSVNAAAVLETYTKPLGEQDINALITTLQDGVQGVFAGDMKRAEAMLYGQAHALQAIFMNLSRRAANQEYLKQWEAYLRMALKAQNQCRMTLETLATIKNPPVVIARQANINNGGQQQVNNGTQAATPPEPAHIAQAGAHAANQSTEQTKLLEARDGQRLDTRATGAASGVNQELEAVGEVHRPAN